MFEMEMENIKKFYADSIKEKDERIEQLEEKVEKLEIAVDRLEQNSHQTKLVISGNLVTEAIKKIPQNTPKENIPTEVVNNILANNLKLKGPINISNVYRICLFLTLGFNC